MAASIAVLPEMRDLILAGRADHHAEPFMRARLSGYRQGIEDAAKVAEGENCLHNPSDQFEAGHEVACIDIIAAIRKLGEA